MKKKKNFTSLKIFRDAQTAISTLATLSKCSTSVESGCAIPSGTYNSTELNNCEKIFTAVKEKNDNQSEILQAEDELAIKEQEL